MTNTLKVGIIGASAERGWARISHVPAVQGLAGLELAAVATNGQASAEAAAHAFKVKGYADATQLLSDPTIDIVTIAVKVPDHRSLVEGAIKAGKHVYCEWPLGRNLEETQYLAEKARARGIKVAVGLQTRANSALRKARDTLQSGDIGRVLSARILSTTMAFGQEVEEAMAFAENPQNGATLVTIQGAHTIDTAIAVLGKLAQASALTTTQFPEVQIAGVAKVRSTHDHILIQARLDQGAALSVETAGGRKPKETPFYVEIIADKGSLVLRGGAPRGFQSGRLTLMINGIEQSAEIDETSSLSDTAANVAGVYCALRDDILNDTTTAPGFDHAVRLKRLMDDLLSSSKEGVCKRSENWPSP